jgi:hypothetical protein
MAYSLEFIALGDQRIEGVPLRCVPLAEPRASALYWARIRAALSSAADYVCFVDGGEDVCAAGFADAMQALADTGAALGYAAETIHGKAQPKPVYSRAAYLRDFTLIHHGAVCRVDALREIAWPDGCFCWEVIAYGTLAEQSAAFDPVPRYDWRPGPGGARLWVDYTGGIVNSLRWLQGLPGPHLRSDY